LENFKERMMDKKLFEAILQESTQNEAEWKDFSQVEEGDRGEDYNGEKCTINLKASARSLANAGYADISELLGEGVIDDNDGCVVVDFDDGESDVAYVYGSDGVLVKKTQSDESKASVIGTWGSNPLPNGYNGPCPNCGGKVFGYAKLPMTIMHGADYNICRKCGAMYPYEPWREGENHD
jgi:hypothetical protein